MGLWLGNGLKLKMAYHTLNVIRLWEKKDDECLDLIRQRAELREKIKQLEHKLSISQIP